MKRQAKRQFLAPLIIGSCDEGWMIAKACEAMIYELVIKSNGDNDIDEARSDIIVLKKQCGGDSSGMNMQCHCSASAGSRLAGTRGAKCRSESRLSYSQICKGRSQEQLEL